MFLFFLLIPLFLILYGVAMLLGWLADLLP